jgi:hypothetical protein
VNDKAVFVFLLEIAEFHAAALLGVHGFEPGALVYANVIGFAFAGKDHGEDDIGAIGDLEGFAARIEIERQCAAAGSGAKGGEHEAVRAGSQGFLKDAIDRQLVFGIGSETRKSEAKRRISRRENG